MHKYPIFLLHFSKIYAILTIAFLHHNEKILERDTVPMKMKKWVWLVLFAMLLTVHW